MNNKVSIIMGVYNEEHNIKEAIDSILNQTYSSWEFIICDDSSTDNTYDILLDYKRTHPDKFKILKNEKNSKLSFSLNRCLKVASGKYIARMDADDISAPDRLEQQVAYLTNNAEVDLVGTAMQRFNDNGFHDVVLAPKNPDKYALKQGTPFNHATILTYKAVYRKLNGYTVSELTNRSQDIDLWFRFFYNGFKGQNLKSPLYFVREDIEAIKRRTIKTRINSYLIRLKGYKLLEYPSHWYLSLTVSTIIKLLIPFQIQKTYRKIQAKKSKRILEH